MIDNTKATWRSIWNQHYMAYVTEVPRQAYYLYFILQREDRRILEIAAGSFRDTVRLNEWGYDCTGTDFLEDVVQIAKEYFPDYRNRMFSENASCLSFSDKFFDVSFHNGFYVLFQDNKFIDSLIREQARVTRRCMVCTVHNKLNKQLVELFGEKAVKDSLYAVRFYHPDEIAGLLQPHCHRVEVLPFGTPIFDRLIRIMWWFPQGLKWCYSGALPKFDIRKCERIMAVGYLR